MRLDEPGHALGEDRLLMPAQKDRFSQFRPFGIVTVIGIAALVDAADTRQALGDIVKERGIADGQVRRRMGDGRQRMDPGVKEMERLRLGRIRQMAQLRQNRYGFINTVDLLAARAGAKARADEDVQAPVGRRRDHEAVHFLNDPFQGKARHAAESPGHGFDQLFRSQEIELACKTAGPEKAQGIFLEAEHGIAHRDQALLAQVLLAADVVVNLTLPVHGQGVDGEIAAQHVFAQGRSIPDLVRPVTVLSVGFTAEGSYFEGLTGDDDDDDAEGFAVDFHRMPALYGSDAPDIIRPGRRRNIIVMGLLPHEQIADSAADDIRFKTGIFQGSQHLTGSFFHSPGLPF